MLKLSDLDPNNTAICSDLHLSHNREFLFGKRGFASMEEHNDTIRGQWLRDFDQDTVVINLGDVQFGDPEGEKFEAFSQWPCKIQYLLWGNHNSGSKQAFYKATGGIERYPVRVNNVEFVGRELSAVLNRKRFEFSHFPKRIWDDMNRLSIHLSGHSHGNDEGRNLNANSGRCLDVGVENALIYSNGERFYFTLQDIFEILSNQENSTLDHHE